MAKRMETLNIPGVAVGVVPGDQVLYVQGYGTTSSSAAVMPQTPFLLAAVWGTIRTGLVYRAGYGK